MKLLCQVVVSSNFVLTCDRIHVIGIFAVSGICNVVGLLPCLVHACQSSKNDHNDQNEVEFISFTQLL